jgi:tetratricopeptide (TPR) repeat protein
MEAAWLAAVIVVPVFFNVYSSRIFEPDKLTLLRTLALVILAAWLVKLVEEGGIHWERIKPGKPRLRSFLEIPLVIPVFCLALMYLVATLFSVTRYTSLWGSYQRLQGTYTTFSYLVVFACMAMNLRRRAQVERLVGAVIISSLPVSLYGILQRYKIDPIPWGGDTSYRIASNLGNSIFVAAYLIMVFPLTLMRIVESFESLMSENGWLWPNFVRATGYVFIIATQGIALYFSGSRGPWLGWATSLVLLWLGLSLIWRKRWLTISGVSIALLAGIFLVLLNIPSGPFESLRNRPEFGRLGQLLDAESRTGRVRTLIWSGASELVQPHQPLEFPDGRKDAYNAIRPLIGYGPESMYVAYNPFYPPDLTQVEKRNASPDRSHNETWDSLVITGVLGLIVYLSLFGSVIYYGLKWLGMVRGVKQRNLYLALYLSGGLTSSILFVSWKGLPYLGVALPFGMIVGVMVYLILVSLFGRLEAPTGVGGKLRAYLLLGLLGAVVAHFMEINFGIAIAVTRTYFWSFSALILLVGYVLPLHEEFKLDLDRERTSEAKDPLSQSTIKPDQKSRKREQRDERSTSKKRRQSTAGRQSGTGRNQARSGKGFLSKGWPEWLQEALIVAFIVGILLTILGFDLITNASRKSSAMDLIGASLTTLPNAGMRASPGIFMLFLTAWLIGVLLLVSESVGYLPEIFSPMENVAGKNSTWLKMIGLALVVSLILASVFWLWHASALVDLTRTPATTMQLVLDQVKSSEGLLTNFYVFLFTVMFTAAFILPVGWPRFSTRMSIASVAVSLGVFVVVFILASYTNLRVIQADIAFKTGDLFANPENWPVAINIYNHANKLAPNEDYYYLFLGRAYLEYAKSLQDPEERERLIAQAADDLKKAQEINPLNTDHTANLARLYSLWSTYTTDPTLHDQRALASDEYFSKAVILSPKNARLWDEWAVHKQNILGTPDEGYEKLQHALEIDPLYDWTYGLLGDYYARHVGEASESGSAERQEALVRASDYYSKALSLSDSSTTQLRYSYAVGKAGIQAQLGNYDQAITSYQKALDVWPDNPEVWKVDLVLARIYAQIGDTTRALEYAQNALVTAPEDQHEGIQNLITQFGGQP